MNKELCDLVPLGASDDTKSEAPSSTTWCDLVPFPKGKGEPDTKSTKVQVGRLGAKKEGEKAAPSRPQPANRETAGNVRGGSRDPLRGAACTPLWLARAVGRWGLDPFSNERSHIIAERACWLERGDDGFGDVEPADRVPGLYTHAGRNYTADAATRVWLQPDYRFTLNAYRHYAHTRWCALLRFDPRPEWFDLIHDAAEAVCIPRGTYDVTCTTRLSSTFNFELAPGLSAPGNTFPHSLYYRRFEDVTSAVKRTCIVYRRKPRN